MYSFNIVTIWETPENHWVLMTQHFDYLPER